MEQISRREFLRLLGASALAATFPLVAVDPGPSLEGFTWFGPYPLDFGYSVSFAGSKRLPDGTEWRQGVVFQSPVQVKGDVERFAKEAIARSYEDQLRRRGYA